ncbi:retrovirus-related pol polyprotein from transposon TNT 1-94 [Tanacetum coccineum]
MSPEWDRFVTTVKLNKGLKETNHEQLYAYLKQHEKHAAQDRLIIEKITPTTNDQLAFVSSVQPYAQLSHVQSHQYPSSSTPLQSPHVQSLQYPQFAESSHLDSGYTQTDEILDMLTKQVAFLAQSFRVNLPQINNQLRTSSNTRNQATVQDDVDNQPVRDLALNEDNIFQAYECDAFDLDVDDEPIAQSIFIANLSSVGPVNLQAANKSDEVSHLDYKSLDSQNLQLKETVTALQERLENFKAENEKVKQHYQELFNSIKITRVKTIEKTTSLQTKIENLKTQLKGKRPCVTSNVETPKVSVLEKYAIDVHPLPQPQRNNRGVHHGYLNRLRDTLDTLREIVEEARSNRPSDNSLEYACVYTKHSQELLEYVNASCPKADNKRDKFIATTPLTRKKHVTFTDPLETSGNNTPKHIKQKSVHQTNVPIIPSIGVSIATTARRSQPKSNTTHDKTLPTISVPKKNVEDHPRINKSKLSKKNRVNSSISISSFKVVQIVLWYLDSGCSKHMTGDRLRLKNFIKKFIGTVTFGNDHFGAIIGYEDYVIGDSVISRVYYVEALGHNLFFVGQFCDFDLEVAFRKHTCFVKDLDGIDLIKGSHGTNLYTISIEDIMRSSPICLLSKASKNKSWLWHRRLNHLNFGTLNDLARKDLVRVLLRLKFEKDHLCSACQLGKSRKATHKPKTVNTMMEVLHILHMDLCGPMRVQSIKGKIYILVIVDDYLKFTWVKFFRSKDETLEFVAKLLKQLQVGLNKTVRNVRTDNGT